MDGCGTFDKQLVFNLDVASAVRMWNEGRITADNALYFIIEAMERFNKED